MTDDLVRRGHRDAAPFRVEVVEPDAWSGVAADEFEAAIRSAIGLRGRCVIGLSGGSTPASVFVDLARRDLAWDRVVLVQVDERIAAIGTGDRNLTGQLEAFAGLPVRWLPLPVASPIDEGIAGFLDEFAELAGTPPTIDVLHLGLGSDGHTASLIPGDPVLGVVDVDVAITGDYQGTRRVTLTRPALDRARLVLWLVKGADKASALARLLAGDATIPAGLLDPVASVVVADTAAAPDR